jgi:hypothetical protein
LHKLSIINVTARTILPARASYSSSEHDEAVLAAVARLTGALVGAEGAPIEWVKDALDLPREVVSCLIIRLVRDGIVVWDSPATIIRTALVHRHCEPKGRA